MPEVEPAAPVETETATPAEAVEEAPELGDAGKKAIAAERKRADTLERELKAFRLEAETRANAELTELERFKKENDELRNSQSAAELKAARNQVALDKGLTPNQAKRLVGTTPEELAADADELLADLGKQTSRPAADLSQGVKTKVGSQTPADEFADIIRAQTKRG